MLPGGRSRGGAGDTPGGIDANARLILTGDLSQTAVLMTLMFGGMCCQCWGAWRYAECAGGCSDFSTFSRNPQYRVTVRGVAGQPAPSKMNMSHHKRGPKSGAKSSVYSPPAAKKKRPKTRVSTAAEEAKQAQANRAVRDDLRAAEPAEFWRSLFVREFWDYLCV